MTDELVFRVDPLNPGQFFACCGLLDLLGGEAEGWFRISPRRFRQSAFCVSGAGTKTVAERMELLRNASVEVIEHPEKSVAPVSISAGDHRWELDWWLDEFRAGTTDLKCWAGQVTSVRLFEELLRLLDPNCPPAGMFEAIAPTKSKFGVDPRASWNALDFGFSPDQHNLDAATYPAVEVLAAFGLQSFRPLTIARRKFRYCLWQTPLAAAVARLGGTAAWDGLPHVACEFEVAKRGQSYKYFTAAKPTPITRT